MYRPARRLLSCLLLTWMLVPTFAAAQNLDHLWHEIQKAQNNLTNACGRITETRTSKLMAKPMVLHGRFCAAGQNEFMLEYAEPVKMSIRYNGGILNVASGTRMEAMEIGSSVNRAQVSFSRDTSLEKLKKNFTITVQEEKGAYVMKFLPRSDAFRKRIRYFIVKLASDTYLPRTLEVDGTSGVNSVFDIEITSTNTKLPSSMFEVYKAK